MQLKDKIINDINKLDPRVHAKIALMDLSNSKSIEKRRLANQLL